MSENMSGKTERLLPTEPGYWWYVNALGELTVAKVMNRQPVDSDGESVAYVLGFAGAIPVSNQNWFVEWICPVEPYEASIQA